MSTSDSDVLIIGGGPAGYTAAIYAARAHLRPLLQPGGQLITTTEVENWPGEIAILGPVLMTKMRDQAVHFGTRLIPDSIIAIDLRDSPFRCTTASGEVYTGTSVILATGAQARWLGSPSENVYRGYGVSACATCDGFFFGGVMSSLPAAATPLWRKLCTWRATQQESPSYIGAVNSGPRRFFTAALGPIRTSTFFGIAPSTISSTNAIQPMSQE